MARTQDDLLGNWAFIHHPDESRWTWRQLKIDGSIELTSSAFSDFGAVVGDVAEILPSGRAVLEALVGRLQERRKPRGIESPGERRMSGRILQPVA